MPSNDPGEQFGDGWIALRQRLAIFLRHYGPKWEDLTGEQQKLLRDIRKAHGQMLVREALQPSIDDARGADDLEAARSLYAYLNAIDVEGRDWQALDSALSVDAVIAHTELERLSKYDPGDIPGEDDG